MQKLLERWPSCRSWTTLNLISDSSPGTTWSTFLIFPGSLASSCAWNRHISCLNVPTSLHLLEAEAGETRLWLVDYLSSATKVYLVPEVAHCSFQPINRCANKGALGAVLSLSRAVGSQDFAHVK